MITVENLLSPQSKLGFKLLAGTGGLNREVRTVTVIDAPSSTRMFLGREIVLTTGFIYKDSEYSLYDLVCSLIEAGSSALGIKLGRYLQEVPPAVLELSEQNNFPLFTVPMELVWSDAITYFHDLRTGFDSNETLLGSEVAQFERMVLFGNLKIEVIRKKFVEMLGIATVIVDAEYKVIASNELDGCDEILDYINRLLEGKLSWPPVYLQQAIRIGAYWIAEIVLSSTEHLILASTDRTLSRNVMQLLQTLYTTSTQKSIRKIDRTAKIEQFIEGIMFEQAEVDVQEMASALLFDQGNNYCVLVIAGMEHAEIYQRIIELLKKKDTAAGWEIHGISKRNEREHVVFCRATSNQLSSIEAMADLRVLFHAPQLDKENCRIYVGTMTDSIRGTQDSYKQARATQRMAGMLWPDHTVMFAYDTEVLSALHYASVNLDEIEYLRRKINTFDACATLEAYLESDSLKRAADAMFIHENTMRYRLLKLSETLQMDLTNPMNKLNLLVRIKLYKINNYKEK